MDDSRQQILKFVIWSKLLRRQADTQLDRSQASYTKGEAKSIQQTG